MTSASKDYAAMAEEMVAGTLSPKGFGHRDHVATAWELLQRHEVFHALALYANGLRKVTEAAGVPEKFNATVTLAFISLIAARMEGDRSDSADAFVDANLDLLDRDVLAAAYPADVLRSDRARRIPLIPALT